MKKLSILLIVASFVLMGCPIPVSDEEMYYPVFMSRTTLESSMQYMEGERDMKVTGKIYYWGNYIFVNERYQGVHVINIENPENPIKEGFIVAHGCLDMAVKENILYLDNAVDLVSFDLNTKQITSRLRNVFPEPLPPDDLSFCHIYDRPDGYIIVEWIKVIKETNERY